MATASPGLHDQGLCHSQSHRGTHGLSIMNEAILQQDIRPNGTLARVVSSLLPWEPRRESPALDIDNFRRGKIAPSRGFSLNKGKVLWACSESRYKPDGILGSLSPRGMQDLLVHRLEPISGP